MREPRRPEPAQESAAGEEDPGSALDAEGADTHAGDDPSGLVESPIAPGAAEAQKKGHTFPDSGGSAGAESFRTRKELRGDSKPLHKR